MNIDYSTTSDIPYSSTDNIGYSFDLSSLCRANRFLLKGRVFYDSDSKRVFDAIYNDTHSTTFIHVYLENISLSATCYF